MNESLPKIRVLLADDHAVVRAGIRQFLDTAGDILVEAEAGDGAEAIQLIQRNPPDVAVLDIQMPRMTGIEVTRWIRQRQPGVGILILTAYDDAPYALSVLQAGANGYVLKTAAPQEIIQAVRDVHAGKSVVDAVIAQKLVSRLSHPLTAQVNALSERELEVLSLAAKGLTNKLIAVQLNISDPTVQGHLAHIFAKLQMPVSCRQISHRGSAIPPSMSLRDRRTCTLPVVAIFPPAVDLLHCQRRHSHP